MKIKPTYRLSTRSNNKAIILRSLFVLLVGIIAFDCWNNSQELVINSDMIEVVDNMEELENKKNNLSDLEKDDDVLHHFSFRSLQIFQSASISYNSFPLGFDYFSIPLLPPELG